MNPQRKGRTRKFSYTGAGCIPAEASGTGTMTSAARIVTGTGTKFTTELQEGYWLWADSELRRIETIVSDTELILESAFTSALSADVVKYTYSKYTKVSVSNVGATPGSIGGCDGILVAFPAGMSDAMEQDYGLEPIQYNATGTIFFATVQY